MLLMINSTALRLAICLGLLLLHGEEECCHVSISDIKRNTEERVASIQVDNSEQLIVFIVCMLDFVWV